MSVSDGDEDLERAIALSLQQTSESKPSGIKAEIIDLISDDDDDDNDLDAPLSTKHIASRSQLFHVDHVKGNQAMAGIKNVDDSKFAKQTSISGLSAVSISTTSTHTVPTQDTKPSGLLGLDRKKMEEERLDRANRKKVVQEVSSTGALTKRKASISSPTAEGYRKVKSKPFVSPLHLADPKEVEETGATQHQPPGKVPAGISRQDEANGSNPEALSFNQQQAPGVSGIQYPDGVVKKTWVYGCPRQGDEIKIEEVLQKNDLELAVLGAFQVDPDVRALDSYLLFLTVPLICPSLFFTSEVDSSTLVHDFKDSEPP
jgi:hypothetical protein